MELAQINKKSVQNVTDLKKRIETVFEVNLKAKEIELPIVKSVSLPQKTQNMMIITAHGYDIDSAKHKLQEVINHLKILQDKELNSYTSIQEKRLKLVNDDITRNNELYTTIKKEVNNYQDRLLNISKQDAALAGIYSIEIGKKQTELNDVTNKIYELKNIKNDLELSISPLKVQNVHIIGNIEIPDFPVKPKKKLIVLVAFITGLMFSIFLIFILEFIQGTKEEN